MTRSSCIHWARRSALAAVLLVAACGGDQSAASVDTVPPTTVATTVVTTTTTTIATTTTTSTVAPTLVGDPLFDGASTVSTVGIDRVMFGMTLNQAERALEGELVPVSEPFNIECYKVRPAGGPVGVEFTVTAGTIERVDLSTDLVTTRSGAGVGSTEESLRSLFGDSVHTEARSGGGNNIVFTPSDASDAAFRVIFETDGTTVTRFRSGRVPQVEPTDFCGP